MHCGVRKLFGILRIRSRKRILGIGTNLSDVGKHECEATVSHLSFPFWAVAILPLVAFVSPYGKYVPNAAQ